MPEVPWSLQSPAKQPPNLREEASICSKENTLGPTNDVTDFDAHRHQQRVWGHVSLKPLYSLWDLRGIPITVLAKRTMNAFLDDNLLGRAAELGYYFLFALFPTLVSASSILGLAAKSATTLYANLLHYFA